LQAWPVYLQLLLMPVVLLADYGPRILMPAPGPTPAAIGGALILAVLTVGGLISWRRGRGDVALALLWLPVTLLPVSNLIIPIGIIVAERTLYVPSLALALGVALAADRLSLRPPLRLPGAAALALVFVLFAGRTLVRIPEWRSTDSIFAALLRDRPDSFRAHWHHARTASAGGRHDVALERYARALELWPFRRRLVIETTRAAGRAGNLSYAREVAGFAYGRWPTDPEAARLFAATTLDLGDTVAARHIIRDALQRIPGDSLLVRMQHAISERTDE
jgi:hypothetical protein